MRLFPSGQFVMTQGISAEMAEVKFAKYVHESLQRHIEGDWGDMDEHDLAVNAEALKDGGRLFSAYERDGLPKVWIITESDRSVTTVLLPDEY